FEKKRKNFGVEYFIMLWIVSDEGCLPPVRENIYRWGRIASPILLVACLTAAGTGKRQVWRTYKDIWIKILTYNLYFFQFFLKST
ncbi:MAG: hypothetical protein IJU92_10120, partial [Spirochaetaceae bacterium]|nr:hypothetical protein [Spirochaetaceae bacterium]